MRYSKLHQKADMPDLREQAIESIWNGSDGREMDRELLRKAIYGLSDMFDFLCEFGGVEEHFRLVDPREHPISDGPFVYTPGFFDFPERTQNTKSTDHSMGPGWMGTFVVEKMLEQCEKLDIPVLTRHRAAAIRMDEAGRFQSVEAQGPDGTVVVEADCCLIATGGFARNHQVVEQVRPTFYEGLPVHTFTVASNTGDAIGMVEAIGDNLDFKHVKVPMMGPVHHPFNYGVVSLVNSPWITLINMEGRRFQNEAAPPVPGRQTGPLENQPQHKAYAIFDSITAEKMRAELLERSQGNPGLYRGMVSWKEHLEYECGLDLAAKKADTIPDLARLIGIDPDSLSREIETYNRFCAQGADGEFQKPAPFLDPVEQGPFYAVLMLRFNEGAEGGIANDSSLRVLREDSTLFYGLYITGDCCRGVLKQDDEGGKVGEMPWAMASGYLAGAEMAAYQKEPSDGGLR